MKNLAVQAIITTFMFASLTGCQSALEVQAQPMALPTSVNSDIARQLAQGVDQDSPAVRLGAGDRFGAIVHDRYLEAVRETRVD